MTAKLSENEAYLEVAAEAIWRQHMQKLEPEDQTTWDAAPLLGRGMTRAYAKSALQAVDDIRSIRLPRRLHPATEP